MSKNKSIEGRGLFRALESIIWYDGHAEWLKKLRDDMERHLKDGEDIYICPFNYTEWHTEHHTIYMLLAGMFGDWGTSIRGGWIEDIEGCIKFIDAICKKSWEKDEREEDERRESD